MAYEIALGKAWNEIAVLSSSPRYNVKLLNDIYEVNVTDRVVQLKPSGAAASEDAAILILHYLTGILKHGYKQKGEWISFKEVWGGQSFYPAFKDSTLRPLEESLKRDPDGLLKDLMERFGGQPVEGGDASVELVTFPEVRIRIIFWNGDEELPPEVTILFDRGLAEIITTEDIAVLLNFVAKSIVGQEL
ncbi:MAG TPA: DUF3786 domain-containing protein [Methanothrix sp.]|nr:DUF3786 domain-containing protein [Methanothrix sp.]HPC89100.1 DUF3786 domain-containing protein [Methanothrix sp.]HQE87171.1 DUF3786 domain-containing protein [Methanothrix sp.]HQI67923.1 DUF3786 domain-containing protein [Methanothrix sp.]HRS84506.1 DUF3786 domain-containing protein [Methanothrix sp.]